MTHKLYMHLGAPVIGRASVTAIVPGEQPIIRLSETVFHVKGGGQLADQGLLAGAVRVLDVRHAPEGEVDHIVDTLDGLSVGDVIDMHVDEARRLRNSALHSAGHLIAGVLERPFPALTPLGAHHYPGECRVEFRGDQNIVDALKARLPGLLEAAMSGNLPIEVTGDPERARAIRIGDMKPIPCGGTHAVATGSIPMITVTGVKVKDGKVRVSYSLD